ncbi:unnamed protein product [Rotaria magnacalcarata]|uniref:Uncharacterized protein n=1 Tax=Rotaria magnacalcarata TaxID=392030 RepID=A0A819BQ36_9BILA|nr:unnamed protein product [Rotaria magnacalcarata]CAF2235941.1 unnamed protein product [Rotaria magnacalcarata]CAF3805802.1 unnamed protein product [Rotaria magnacalcarata]CAF3853958.1 unnamed protein product [Rotaria magnacalcarata]
MLLITICLIPICISTRDGFTFHKQNQILLPSVAFRDHSTTPLTTWTSSNQRCYYQENLLAAGTVILTMNKAIEKNLEINRIKLFTGAGQNNQNVRNYTKAQVLIDSFFVRCIE